MLSLDCLPGSKWFPEMTCMLHKRPWEAREEKCTLLILRSPSSACLDYYSKSYRARSKSYVCCLSVFVWLSKESFNLFLREGVFSETLMWFPSFEERIEAGFWEEPVLLSENSGLVEECLRVLGPPFSPAQVTLFALSSCASLCAPFVWNHFYHYLHTFFKCSPGLTFFASRSPFILHPFKHTSCLAIPWVSPFCNLL